MASLRDTVKQYQEELRDGIAWVAFWREGRSWNGEDFYLDAGDSLTAEQESRLEEIRQKDPAAVILNSYYCGYLAGDMTVDELTAGVRRHYENGYNDVADFIAAHDDTLSPEVLEKARALAHAAGLPFYERPYNGEEIDPYIYDGYMSIEDYELMHQKIAQERSEHLAEQFSILIDSRNRFETGQPGGVWLPMPTTTEQLHKAMNRIGITAENSQDFFINGFANTEQQPFDVPFSVIQSAGIDELNYFGKLLEMLHDKDRDKFAAAVTLGEYAGSVKDLINLAQNLDCYWIYPAVQDEEAYGHYLIDELDELELPEAAKNYFMYEEYGRDAVKNDGGIFTAQGYIYNNKNTFSEWYSGHENDIPKEYRIMSFPQPERPDLAKVEMDAAAPPQQSVPPAAAQEPRPVIPIVLTSEKPADKLKEITDRLEKGIMELFDSDRYKEYLRVMSKFHNYSFNNTLLIAMQKPDASLVAGFQSWKNNFKRNVVKGEKGIKILAPSPFKIRQEMEKIDPATQKTVIGADGKPVKEEKEITIPAFKVVSVFDVSQTEGKELPDIAVDMLTGDVERFKDVFAALEKTSPVPIGFEKIEGNSHGYYHLEEKRIAIDEGMSELQTIKTAIHEIAHAKLHDIDPNAPKEEQADRPDRRTREVQAESVAYAVCQHYGLDTSDYSFGYVAGWSSGRELDELKSSLETIRSTAAEIINSIDEHLQEIQKEREARQTTSEPTVTVVWSESNKLRDGQTMPLSEAVKLFASLDEANRDIPGYDKTAFRIDFVMNGVADSYEGRQDFGDGDGGLIEHIEKYHAYYANNPDWDNYLLRNKGKEALDADKAQREMLLHEFVPYLKLHSNLSEMEQAAKTALQRGEDMSQTETAYYTALQQYVSDCRIALNQGNYELPPAPQLADFDVELQAYKQQVREEVAQEAASIGMTVEEYAASGYEPYAAAPDKDTFSIYQLKRGDETRDFRFEPYDRLAATGRTADQANYDLIYTAELTPGTSLEDIYTRFNIDHPKDFKGHSLSVSDVVVLHQNGQDTAHYVDSSGYRQVPEFLQPPEKENPLKHVEDTIEQNDNNFDGIINNTPSVDELEKKAKSGEQISLTDLADAIKAEKTYGKGKEEKPSIRAQLKVDKKKAQKKTTKQKSQNLERS